MPKPLVYLNSIVHANPCSEDWDAMPGDEWTRRCDKCDQNVFNLSAMTAREAEALLERHEGKVCTKLYRRPDGSVLTQRCPSGIRKGLLRIGRWAAAAGFAIPALAHDGMSCSRGQVKITRSAVPGELSELRGIVADLIGGVIPGTEVSLSQRDGSQRTAVTDPTGSFEIQGIRAGVYDLSALAEGFETFRKDSVAIATHESLDCRITLQVGSVGGNA